MKNNHIDYHMKRKLEVGELSQIYGGWAWQIFLPLVIHSISSLLGSVRLFFSESGSMKVSPTGSFEGKWENESPNENKTSKVTNTIVYAY